MINKQGKPSVMIALNLARKNKGGANGQMQDEGQKEETGSEMNGKGGSQDIPAMMQDMHDKMQEMVSQMEDMMTMMEE